MNITLNEKSKRSIQKSTGLSYEQIFKMNVEAIDNQIEEKIKRKLIFKPDKDSDLISRGSPYFYLNEFLDYDFNDNFFVKLFKRLSRFFRK